MKLSGSFFSSASLLALSIIVPMTQGYTSESPEPTTLTEKPDPTTLIPHSYTSSPPSPDISAPVKQSNKCSTGTPYCCSPGEEGNSCIQSDVECNSSVICCNNNNGIQLCFGDIDIDIPININITL